MRLLIQRVRRASVEIRGAKIAEIGPGMLVLVGVTQSDQAETAQLLAEKTAYLRIFDDSEGKMIPPPDLSHHLVYPPKANTKLSVPRTENQVVGLKRSGPSGHKSGGGMNLDIQQVQGEILVVSQFTLYADLSRGRRPGFEQAAKPDHAELVYRFFCQALRRLNLKVQEGRFQEQMIVSLENDGPATFWLEK